MAELTTALLRDWQHSAARDQPIAVAEAMRQLTFRFVAKALFSTDPSAVIDRLEASIITLLNTTWRSLQSPWHDFINRAPTRPQREFAAALHCIDDFITRMIADRRAQPATQPDLLTLLLAARDRDTGEGLADEEIRNECITLLIAGYDTTANALAWAVHELAAHPHVAEALAQEADTVLAGRSPTLLDLARLPLGRAVFLETLRLHPPIWILERNLDAPVNLAPWHLPAGTQVLISPYILHRLPQCWPRAAEFVPERFVTSDVAETNPAFLPFGAGPRTCVGQQLAMLEGQVFLAVLAQAGRLTPTTGQPLRAEAGLSLRPGDAAPLRFVPRADLRRTETASV